MASGLRLGTRSAGLAISGLQTFSATRRMFEARWALVLSDSVSARWVRRFGLGRAGGANWLGSISAWLPILLVLAAPLAGQTIVIDAGGAGDTGYSSPAGYPTVAYTIPTPIPLPIAPPGTNDLTMRYGQSFAYDIQVAQAGWYTIVLQFVEPTVQAAGQRVFSVWANDQPIVQNLDLFAAAGYLAPTARSALVSIPGTTLHLSFIASARNAVVSAITITYTSLWGAIWITPSIGGQSVDGEIPAGAFDGVNTTYTLAFAPNPPTSLHYARKGIRVMPGPATFQLSGNVLTIVTPLQAAESLIVDYRH